jgi:hypothetical protein
VVSLVLAGYLLAYLLGRVKESCSKVKESCQGKQITDQN